MKNQGHLSRLHSLCDGQNLNSKFYALIFVTVHFMAVNSGGGRGVCIHASNSSSGDPLLTAGVGEQP